MHLWIVTMFSMLLAPASDWMPQTEASMQMPIEQTQDGPESLRYRGVEAMFRKFDERDASH